jgi:hypothetical protein
LSIKCFAGEEAYAESPNHAFRALRGKKTFETILFTVRDKDILGRLILAEIADLWNLAPTLRHVEEIFRRVLESLPNYGRRLKKIVIARSAATPQSHQIASLRCNDIPFNVHLFLLFTID